MQPWNLFVHFNSRNGGIDLDYEYFDEKKNSNPSSDSPSSNVMFGSSTSEGVKAFMNSMADKRRAHYVFDVLVEEMEKRPADLADGKFSFVEHNSGFGYLSTLVSKTYENATVISLEADEFCVEQHVRMLKTLGIKNNAVCQKKSGGDSLIFKNLYESPELFRFQAMATGFLDSFRDSDDLYQWGSAIGSMLSTSLTTFIGLPSSDIISLAMYIFFGSFDVVVSGFGRGPIRPMKEIYGDTIPNEMFASLNGYEEVLRQASLSKRIGSNNRDQKSYSDTCGQYVNPEMSVITVNIEDASDQVHLWSHPNSLYEDFESSLLLIHARALAGDTKVKVTPVYFGTNNLRSPLTRIDITNMTRGVHHHFDYAKDGHKRTYTMRVYQNSTQTDDISDILGNPSKAISKPDRDKVTLWYRDAGSLLPISKYIVLPQGSHPNFDSIVNVNLMRASTIPFYIPYTSIYGVTLITVLRLGLETSQREELFSKFINLSLYEDMAPWNIVLMGKGLDYIDYDTRDVTFDKYVPKAYQVMSVLMNYKRTVEDFKRCGAKASTVYGIAFVSDCVGSSKGLKCDDLSKAVPCPDGECHSDYISCLRSLTATANSLKQDIKGVESFYGEDVVLASVVEAMSIQTGKFDGNGLVLE